MCVRGDFHKDKKQKNKRNKKDALLCVPLLNDDNERAACC